MATPRDPRATLLNNARARARRKGVPFEITLDDIVIPKRCPVFGFLLRVNSGYSRDDSPTLDRICPSKGYVPGNIAVISHRANTLKAHARSPKDLYRVADWLWEELKKIEQEETDNAIQDEAKD